MSDLPAVPGGMRAGQVSVLLLGKVIVGDIVVTLVDLAGRGRLTVAPAEGDDWTLTVRSRDGAGATVADYERRLLTRLAKADTAARLSALVPGFGKHMDKARSEIVAGAVRDGWIRRFHHDQRTREGDELAAKVGSFRWSLRRAHPGQRARGGHRRQPRSMSTARSAPQAGATRAGWTTGRSDPPHPLRWPCPLDILGVL